MINVLIFRDHTYISTSFRKFMFRIKIVTSGKKIEKKIREESILVQQRNMKSGNHAITTNFQDLFTYIKTCQFESCNENCFVDLRFQCLTGRLNYADDIACPQWWIYSTYVGQWW